MPTYTHYNKQYALNSSQKVQIYEKEHHKLKEHLET